MKIICLNSLNDRYVKEIAKIEKECFSHAWSEQSIAEEMVSENTVLFAAVDENADDAVMGYIGLHCILDEGYMDNLAVSGKYRHRGVASELLHAADVLAEEKNLSFITLEVRQSNTLAVNLYEKTGYREAGKRKNFYREPTEDAILMTKIYKEPSVNELP